MCDESVMCSVYVNLADLQVLTRISNVTLSADRLSRSFICILHHLSFLDAI